jgi:predicted permease
MVKRAWLWLRSNLLRRRLEREMREEMAEHLARSTQRLMARGLPYAAARRQAEREFGNVTYLQEDARYARGTIWLDALLADVRFALRHFARRPVVTLVMFVVLAVGMSLSTLLFSYVHSYAVQPPPGIAAQDDLVRIRGSLSAGVHGRGSRALSEAELDEYRALTEHFDAVAGWTYTTVALDAADDAERRALEARATFVTPNYFTVLGVQPVPGPGLPTDADADPARAAVAVIGHRAWEELFASDPAVIGSTLSVNGVRVTVVGVAPERFNGVGGYTRLHVWLPLEARHLVMTDPPDQLRAAARLRAGVSRDAATAAVDVIARRIAHTEAQRAGDAETARQVRAQERAADVVPLLSANGDPMFDRDVRLMSLAIGLLALLVLLVTCTNVSALLTGLAAARRQEIAIRLSLGAPRSRIIRQLLTESAVLSATAAAAALGIVWLVLRTVPALLTFVPLEFGVTWPATTFTFAVALGAGVLFGLSPALHATRLAIATVMRDSTGTLAATRARLQRSLVVAQIAFTQPLIVLLAAVLVLVFSQLRPQTAGQTADHLITVALRDAITGSSAVAPAERAELQAAMQRLLDRLRATPGIAAATVDWSALRTPLGAWAVTAEDRTGGLAPYAVKLISERAAPGAFAARGIPLLRGRDFTPADAGPAAAEGADVAIIVGADLARTLWPGVDPLGRRLQPASDTATASAALVVVGVVDDPQTAARESGGDWRIWLPPDSARASLTLLVRTAATAAPLLPTLRSIVQEEMPGMVARVRTVADIEEENLRRFRTITGVLMGAGVMALLLSALGLYAVVAFAVGERAREIAVRMAVGARVQQVIRKFVADGLLLSGIGLALGLPLSLLGLRFIMGLDHDVPPVGLLPVTLIAALGVLLVATVAVWIPARRAAAIDPAVTLRRE